MSREEVVTNGVAAIQAAEVEAISNELGKAFDSGLAEAPVGEGGISQEQVDAMIKTAVDKAIADDELLDIQALADAKAASDLMLADLQTKFDELAVEEELEKNTVKRIQDSLDEVQASFDAIKALLFPA